MARDIIGPLICFSNKYKDKDDQDNNVDDKLRLDIKTLSLIEKNVQNLLNTASNSDEMVALIKDFSTRYQPRVLRRTEKSR